MNSRQKKHKKNSLVSLTVVFLLLITAIPLIISSVFKEKDKSVSAEFVSEHMDQRAVEIKKHFWDKNKKNSEGELSYEINKSITFKGEEQTGKLNFSNPYCNNHFTYVELALKENEEVIFRSGLLKPGEKIESISLDFPLPQGDYEAHAYICAVSPVDEELIGFLTQTVKIEVKK